MHCLPKILAYFTVINNQIDDTKIMKCQNMTMESEPQNHLWSQFRSVLWLLAGAQRVNQVMTGLGGTAIIYFIYISPYFCGRRIILVIALT